MHPASPTALRPVRLPATPLLALAALVHGGFSSPTPDRVAWPEALVAGLLLLALSASGPGCRRGSGRPATRIRQAQGLIPAAELALGLLPLMVGVLRGHTLVDILRDIVPLGFLALPVVLAGRVDGRRLAIWVCFGGGLLALRQIGLQGDPLQWGRQAEDLLYLSNSPTVLFAAVFGVAEGIRSLARRPRATAALLLAAGLAAWIALALTLQRGAAVIGGAALVLGLLPAWRRDPGRLAVFGACLACVVALAAPTFAADWLRGVIEKTATVGANTRAAEGLLAGQVVLDDPVTLLVGLGWGGLIELPSTPGMAVSFLHALPLYLIVKTGLVGTAVAVAAGLPLARRWLSTPCPAPLWAAVTATILVHAVLLPGFKSLGAALVLLAICGCRPRTD